MKKLMIAAAAAAMVSGAFAVGKAQVYDFTATIKTGACKKAKVSKSLENYFEHSGAFASVNNGIYNRDDKIGLRKQSSMKLGGVIWGCDCDTIAKPYWGNPRFYTVSNYLSGYMFWNQSIGDDGTLYLPFSFANPPTPAGANMLTTFDWLVLNRIDSMSKCEGMFVLRSRVHGLQFTLQGAGFGTVKETGCDTYIKSISGNIVGWRVGADDAYGCVFCAANGCVVGLICDSCYEVGLGMDTRLLTAATGTWKLKYNASATKRLSERPFISRAYTFPKKSGNAAAFAEAADRVNAATKGLTYGLTIDPTQCDEDDDDCQEALEDLIADWDEDEEIFDDYDSLDEGVQGIIKNLNLGPDAYDYYESVVAEEDDDVEEALSAFNAKVAKIYSDAS